MATAKATTGRDIIINLRANRNQRAIIDRAAERLGKNRSDFMLEAACRESHFANLLVPWRFTQASSCRTGGSAAPS